jgi:hypothetical protein
MLLARWRAPEHNSELISHRSLLSKHGRHRRFLRYPSATLHRYEPLGNEARRPVFSFRYMPFVVSPSNHEQPFDRLTANGLRTSPKNKSASKGGAMQDTDVSISRLSFPKGRHRRFPRYPIVHLPCPDSSGFRHSRSESVLTLAQVYHSLKLRCKLAAFTESLSLPLSSRWRP